jgi:hypothetical protein
MSSDGLTAHLEAEDVPLIDNFVFFGPNEVPSTVSFEAHWRATGPRVVRGKGKTVPATDPRAFVGQFAFAKSTFSCSGSELGFRFKTNPGASTDPRGFAEMGTERNGKFM